ncbi:MAG: BrnT family toxin [Alphaproteobacteria bacterium]|nr:BrnT family toxin [Alphaproteobacteria bacterium]
MLRSVVGFQWDHANRDKCQKHGVSIEEIEELFGRPVMALPDDAHSGRERRYRAIGRTQTDRHVFIVFTLRSSADGRRIRPISARFMHRKEVAHYEKENPEF